MHSLRQRLIASLLSLLTLPGVGHYYLGAARAAVGWVLVFGLASVALVAACVCGGPAALVVAVLFALLLQLTAALDVIRQRTTERPPWPRVIVLGILAVCATTGLKSLVREYGVETFRIPSESMVPTLKPGDYLLVSKVHRAPARGDVVVYRAVDNQSYVKRVVATEWDTIETRDREVRLNGQPLRQEPNFEPCTLEANCVLARESNAGRSYQIAWSAKVAPYNPQLETRVPLGHVFVIGDARSWSLDSRATGPIATKDIIGFARFVWWPLMRFGLTP